MTPDILEYLLRATVIWTVLLAYYFVSGRREGFRFQRILLLGGWLFGLLVPLLPALPVGSSLPVMSLPTASYVAPVFVAQAGEVAVENSWNLLDALPWIYLLGVIVFGARTLVQWRFVQQCLRGGKRSTYAGYPVVRSGLVRSPFAARGCVFLPEQMPDAALENTALLHETSHLRARHHYDKIILNLGCIVLWFHPLTWAFQRLLATVHEYEADAAVLQSVPARTYGLQLLHFSLGPTGSLGLFSSPLQKRINMIIDKKPKRSIRFLPLFTLCLLLLGLVVACSDVAEEIVLTTTEEAVNVNDPAYFRYGEEPPGETSVKAFLTDMYKTVRYPYEARESATEGDFRVSAVVDVNGKLQDYEVSPISADERKDGKALEQIVVVGYPTTPLTTDRKHPESLSRESLLTVIRNLDKFRPASVEGRPTPMQFTVDFIFKLEK